MAVTYNHDLCQERHDHITACLMKGEIRMTALEKCGSNHEQRLAIMEEVARRQASTFWQLLSPALSVIGSIVSGFVLAYLLTN
jgi:hypothetical protein